MASAPLDTPVRRPSGWSLAAMTYVFTVVMMGTTLPTPLYPDYEDRYGFGAFTTTTLFAVYAAGVLAALVLFGQASARFGRKPVLIAGIALSLISAVMFLAADALWVLYAARVVSGLSAGIFTATGTAAVMENAPEGRGKLASALATAANIGGLGLGVLLAGSIASAFTDPLHLPYLTHVGLLLIAGVAMLVVRETIAPEREARVIQLPKVPASARPVFLVASIGAFTGFATCGIYTAIAPGFMTKLLNVHDPIVIGLVVFLLFGASAVTQILVRSLPERALIAFGAVLLIAGMGVLVLALVLQQLIVLMLAAVLAGMGQGMLFLGGMRAVTDRSPGAARTQATTSYFVVAYIAISVPIIAAGLLTQVLSLTATGILCASIIAAGTAVALFGLGRFRRA